MSTGVIVNEFLDEFPKISRPGAGQPGNRRTDVDIALEQLKDGGTIPSRVLKVIDYNVEATRDDAGNVVSQAPVDPKTAAMRAQARTQSLRKRGYTKDAGWQLAAVGGALYARFWGEGGHPVKEEGEGAANGQTAATVPVPNPVP